jgi:hypothetical protein
MTDRLDSLVRKIRSHRCYSHPIFDSWASNRPSPTTIGALFHQIQNFCAATRPGGVLPAALAQLGLSEQSELLQEIVDSEENHGPELATMAGFIVNSSSATPVFDDLYDQGAVEAGLKRMSDERLGALPGYDMRTGLTSQARRAIAVFDGRRNAAPDVTIKNLGVALALEMISHRHLIPGEKACLIDSGVYGVQIEQPEMHYLLEHWGEVGAEAHHEQNAIDAVRPLVTDASLPMLEEGAAEFLDALCALWDVLDAALLQSGAAAGEDRLAA